MYVLSFLFYYVYIYYTYYIIILFMLHCAVCVSHICNTSLVLYTFGVFSLVLPSDIKLYILCIQRIYHTDRI